MSQAASDFPFESDFLSLHKQCLIILFNFFIIPGGISREHRKKMGIELKQDLINCNRPPYARKVEVATNLLSSLSTKGIRS
jgi:hypothetical protein